MELFKKRKGLRNPSIKTLEVERQRSVKKRDMLQKRIVEKIKSNNNMQLPNTIDNVIEDRKQRAYGKRVNRIERIIFEKQSRKNAKKIAALNKEGKNKFGKNW